MARDYQPQRRRTPVESTSEQDAITRIAAVPARSVTQIPRSPLSLQGSLGNQQVQRLLQRETDPNTAAAEQEAAEELGLSPGEADLFDTIMAELSDEELDGALELEAEASAETAPPGLVQAARSPGLIQRGKQTGISSATSPNITLANKLENNKSRMPRLVSISRWRRIKNKHTKRKYAAIRHQNLLNNTGKEDLMLLIMLRKRAKIGGKRDQHYSAIEAKSNKKNQTAQNRTELLGEAVSAIRMEGYGGGDCKLLVGYASGAGIDQLWKSPSKQIYYVVEAKGPGAALKVDRFAVRGAASGATLTQMSQAWIEDRIPRLHSSNPAVLTQLLSDCGLKITNGKLVDDPKKKGAYTLEGLVITAKWDEGNADMKESVSKRKYQF